MPYALNEGIVTWMRDARVAYHGSGRRRTPTEPSLQEWQLPSTFEIRVLSGAALEQDWSSKGHVEGRGRNCSVRSRAGWPYQAAVLREPANFPQSFRGCAVSHSEGFFRQRCANTAVEGAWAGPWNDG